MKKHLDEMKKFIKENTPDFITPEFHTLLRAYNAVYACMEECTQVYNRSLFNEKITTARKYLQAYNDICIIDNLTKKYIEELIMKIEDEFLPFD